jgi:hypothetical protein
MQFEVIQERETGEEDFEEEVFQPSKLVTTTSATYDNNNKMTPTNASSSSSVLSSSSSMTKSSNLKQFIDEQRKRQHQPSSSHPSAVDSSSSNEILIIPKKSPWIDQEMFVYVKEPLPSTTSTNPSPVSTIITEGRIQTQPATVSSTEPAVFLTENDEIINGESSMDIEAEYYENDQESRQDSKTTLDKLSESIVHSQSPPLTINGRVSKAEKVVHDELLSIDVLEDVNTPEPAVRETATSASSDCCQLLSSCFQTRNLPQEQQQQQSSSSSNVPMKQKNYNISKVLPYRSPMRKPQHPPESMFTSTAAVNLADAFNEEEVEEDQKQELEEGEYEEEELLLAMPAEVSENVTEAYSSEENGEDTNNQPSDYWLGKSFIEELHQRSEESQAIDVILDEQAALEYSLMMKQMQEILNLPGRQRHVGLLDVIGEDIAESEEVATEQVDGDVRLGIEENQDDEEFEEGFEEESVTFYVSDDDEDLIEDEEDQEELVKHGNTVSSSLVHAFPVDNNNSTRVPPKSPRPLADYVNRSSLEEDPFNDTLKDLESFNNKTVSFTAKDRLYQHVVNILGVECLEEALRFLSSGCLEDENAIEEELLGTLESIIGSENLYCLQDIYELLNM